MNKSELDIITDYIKNNHVISFCSYTEHDIWAANSFYIFDQENAMRSVEQSAAVDKALNQVLVAVADIRDRSIQIAAAAEEQATVSSEITKSVSKIGDSANESAEASRVLVVSGNEQAALAKELHDVAMEFKV